MIRFNQVSKYYPGKKGRRYIYRDVNVVLPAGRNIGVLGPNGAGKSTLINMIGGSDRPNAGTVETSMKISWPIGLGGGLQGSMTARENVRFVARINGIRDSQQIENFVAEFAEIGSYFDEPIKNYSSGMRARVGFGLSFAFDFDLLLMDEISAVGDKNFKIKSKKLLEDRINKSNILLVSHSAQQHRDLCDFGVVVKNQGLVLHDNIEDAISDYEQTYEC